MPGLFISYRRSQLAQVRPAVEAMRQAGIDCFFDLTDIDPLADFPRRIRDGIARSHAFLAWWSADYAESDHCLAELTLAWQHARQRSSDVGRRVWVLNPEPGGRHIFAADLNAQNWLRPPPSGAEREWADALFARLMRLTDGPLANDAQALAGPRLFNVPVPSNTFTGRRGEMWRIHSRLHPAQIVGDARGPAVQLHGMGGIGKTELAAKYAHDFAHAYPAGVVWLSLAGYEPGETARVEDAEYAWCAAVEAAFPGEIELLYDAHGQRRTAAQVRLLLEQRFHGGPSLWVLDNVPVLLPESERDRILAGWRAPAASGCTLLTTRDSRPAAGMAAEPLEVLSEDDGLRLLARYRQPSREEKPLARDLVRGVGSHSLALILLGEHLHDGPGGYGRALAHLREAGALAQIEGIAAALRPELGERARGIVATFSISLASLDAGARALIALASVGAPGEPIPVSLLEDAYESFAPAAKPSGMLERWLARLSFTRARPAPAAAFIPSLRRLQRASLLVRRRTEQADDDRVLIHPLVADATLRLLAVEPQEAMEALAGVLPGRVCDFVPDVRRHSRIADDMRQAAYLSRMLQSESAVWLSIWAGRFESARGSLSQARAAEERAVDVGRRIVGDEHPATIIALVNLAGTLQAQGDLSGASARQEEALAVVRKYLDEDDTMVLAIVDNLATMLHDQGRLAESRVLHERTLDARRRVLGPEDPQTLLSMNNLAQVLGAQGDPAAARALNERTLAISARVQGDDHPDTIRLRNNLAQTLLAEGDLPGARALQARALEQYRAVLGEEHPDTLRAVSSLAALLLEEGDIAAARTMTEGVLEVCGRVLGDGHPDTLRTAGNLGMVLYAQGAFDEARARLERVVHDCRRVRGDSHPETLRNRSNLALVCHAQGDFAEARRQNEEVATLATAALGEEHPQTLRVTANLAVVLAAQGDLSGARALQDRTLQIERRRLGARHPYTLACTWNLLKVLEQMGDRDATRDVLAASALRIVTGADDDALPAELRALKPQIQAMYDALNDGDGGRAAARAEATK